MAERSNKPKAEDEVRPAEGETGMESVAAARQGAQGAAVQPAKYPDDTSSTPAACPGVLVVNTLWVQDSVQQSLSGVIVHVEGPAFSDTKTSGASGEIEWIVPTGSYTISVTPPAGYAVYTPPTSPVPVSSDKRKVVRAVFTAAETEIRLQMFHDVKGTGDPADQPGVSGRVQFFGSDGAFLGCTTTNQSGVAIHKFRGVDAVEMRFDDVYSLGCNVLHHRMPSGLHAQLTPGNCLTYTIPLYTTGAEVLVSASVTESGKTRPLEGTRFLLYRGTDVSRAPVAADVFTGAAIRWTDLETDVYTITALAPATERGRRLKPVRPSSGVMHVQLNSGLNDLRTGFVFEPQQDTIVVRVVRDQFNTPLRGVPIDFINQADSTIVPVSTNTEGVASFAAQHALYIVRPSTFKFTAEGQTWFIDSQASFQVDLRSVGAAPAPITMLAQKDVHGVRCIVQDVNGRARSYTAIEIYDDKGIKLKDAHTDASGVLDERLPAAGHYTLVVLPQIHRVSFETHSIEDLGVIRVAGESSTGGGGSGGGFGRIAESFSELTSYPQLMDGGAVGAGGRQRRPSGVSSASTSQYGYTIEGAIREVLGWRPKTSDMRGFTEALTRSFDVKEVEGHTEYEWTPRAAALVVESELGAITGAQKSIYERGKVAFDQAAPKLDAIYPLREDADPENCDAVRYIVRTAFEDLVREFGQSGGPRVQLVNDKFNLLLGNSNLAVTEQLDPTCQLAIMRDRFGLRRNAVNTIAEEENLTNFLIVVDHLKSLRITWNNNIQFFDRTGNDPFLGTQLVLLSRALGNVAEGVDELRYVLSSVLLDEAEQQTILIEYPGQTPLYISELLCWIEHVATVEGPQLLTESGKDGAGALRGTLELLRTLVTGAQNPPNTVPSAYRTARVQRALQELALALQDASRLANIQGVN